MKCFKADIKRAVFSAGFVIGLFAELIVLFAFTEDSTLYTMLVPVICTLPFSCGFLDEYKNGFIKFSLSRSKYSSYILSKFAAAGISGGLCEALALWIYHMAKETDTQPEYILVFLSAALWAAVSILLAAITKSRYLAYGGSFVIYYFMIILYQRYWQSLYCLNPTEWYKPLHIWIFDDAGIVILISLLILTVLFIYYRLLRRLITNA